VRAEYPQLTVGEEGVRRREHGDQCPQPERDVGEQIGVAAEVPQPEQDADRRGQQDRRQPQAERLSLVALAAFRVPAQLLVEFGAQECEFAGGSSGTTTKVAPAVRPSAERPDSAGSQHER
jgi:hypothetical protein